MPVSQPARHAALPLLALLAVSLAPAAPAQVAQLGRVVFPTSASSPAAQDHFLRGVAALHSFWYEEAAEEFRAASRLDPDFMMALWGEAMTYNHPLWGEQDAEAARKIVARLRDLPRLTPRERGFVNALRALYGEGDKQARDEAYSAAMERLHGENPDDLEAASFYALSLLGTVRPGDHGFARQMRAGAIALEVYGKNPEHPGAAHYIIHAFDDPEHAVLALPAARRYAEIAPAAHHARHMPSHIFLQLGMWDDAARSNESAWAASTAWVERKKLSMSLRDYHSLHWLTYVYLQQGRFDEAARLLALKERDVVASNYDASVARALGDTAAAYVLETGRYERAPALIELLAKTRPASPYAPPAAPPAATTSAAPPAAPADSCHAAAATPAAAASQSQPAQAKPATTRDDAFALVLVPHFRGLVAAYTKDTATAERAVTELRALREQYAGRPVAKRVEIKELGIAALLRASAGKFDEAVEMMKRATSLEEELSPPSGPPDLLKPTHELFGEILLRAGRPREAAAQFKVALARHPNRARSLLGAARAAAQSGDRPAAAAAYASLLKIWQRADARLPELGEARSFVQQARAR
jgi:tetratricopeptide (TPR) repeat protein